MFAAFIRTKENFDCEHCGHHVEGSGYTNHCPKCLWSKHVDMDPGDRLSACQGLMEPIAVEGTVARYRIIHRCLGCGMQRKNAVAENDSLDALTALAEKRAKNS